MTPLHTPEQVDWTLTSVRDRALDRAIVELVRPGEKVLDLGCGRGDLLYALKREKGVRERGIELDPAAVAEGIAHGVAVIQDDLTDGLDDLADRSFDVVILNQLIPVVPQPRELLRQALRIGGRVIVTFPNFAYFRDRLRLLFAGRLPVNPALPYQWYDTPNIRVVTVGDFRALARGLGAKVTGERFATLDRQGRPRPVRVLPSLRSSLALFVLQKEM